MTAFAQILQQLVDTLPLDLIGSGCDDVPHRHDRLPQPPSICCVKSYLLSNSFHGDSGKPPASDFPLSQGCIPADRSKTSALAGQILPISEVS
jgi:hypothetical protein